MAQGGTRSDKRDLTKLLQSLFLNPIHTASIMMGESKFECGTAKCHPSLVSRFWTKASINIKFLLLAMQKAWKTASFKIIKL